MSFLPRSLVVAALVAVTAVPLKAQAPDFIKIGEIVQRCRQETGATNEDIQSIFLRRVPETRSGQCMLACAGQGLGLMRDGNLDAEGTVAVAGRLLQGRDQRIQDAVRTAILTCAEYSDTRRDEEHPIKKYASMKSTQNRVQEGYFEPSPSPYQKSLHSKTSSSYQPNHRVRRQSEQNTIQPQGVSPVSSQGTSPTQTQQSTYPNQYQQYPNQQNPNQQYPNQQYPNQQYPNQQPYPLQTSPNSPTDQALQGLSLLSQFVNPNPYNTYPNGAYVQPVVVANPYAVPVVPFRGKRSPQELVLTSTEIALPAEVAAQISERLRELLLALISARDDIATNSTEVSEKDAEVIEDVTRAPRKRREEQSQSKPELPGFEQVLGAIRDRVTNGPLHQIAQGFRNAISNSTNGMNNMNQTVSSTMSSPPAKAR